MVGTAICAAARATTGFSYSDRASRASRHVRRKFGVSVAGNVCANNPAGGFTATLRSPVGSCPDGPAASVFPSATGFHRTAG